MRPVVRLVLGVYNIYGGGACETAVPLLSSRAQHSQKLRTIDVVRRWPSRSTKHTSPVDAHSLIELTASHICVG